MISFMLLSCSTTNKWQKKAKLVTAHHKTEEKSQFKYEDNHRLDSSYLKEHYLRSNRQNWEFYGNFYLTPEGFLRADYASFEIWSNDQMFVDEFNYQQNKQQMFNQERDKQSSDYIEKGKTTESHKKKRESRFIKAVLLAIIIFSLLFFINTRKTGK